MKKIFGLVLVMTALLGLTSCGKLISSNLLYNTQGYLKATIDKTDDSLYSVEVLLNNVDLGMVSKNVDIADKYGANATVLATENNSKFLFWEENGKIISHDKQYSFLVCENHFLTAYFVPIDKYAVIYQDVNDDLIDFKIVEKLSSCSTTKVPSPKFGFTFDGFNEITKVTKNTYVTAKYTHNDEKVSVSIDGGRFVTTNNSTAKFFLGEEVLIKCNNENFTHWTIDGEIVSKTPEFYFTVLKETKIKAVCEGKESLTFITNIQNIIKLSNQILIHCSFSNPNNLPIIEAGLLVTFGENTSPFTSSEVYKIRALRISNNNEYFVEIDLNHDISSDFIAYVITNNGTSEKPVYISHYSPLKTYYNG